MGLAPHRDVDLGDLRTVANLVTLVRTVGAVVTGVVAVVEARLDLLAVAYGVYWIGDMLDGLVARRRGEETRFGAVLDIVSDRACTSVLCVGVIGHLPETAVALVPFFLSFMVLDTMLSLAFLAWPLASPNDFAAVDPMVYRWNWSPPAKAVNTSAVVLLALVGLPWLSLSLVLAVAAVKVWSGRRVLRLLAPAGEGCG
ncbi:CDP-alcohol phosphatidyltransferase [Aeromicrobium erythreum]|uniref:CDP-alcohol phosphatidyltransferase n=1 Tax=Aeromicrobium erythreum TaxID=2041 RepID=A0A0U4C5L9_9ACTN|nr:CDP-alcohol phosphatidyltransferase [Aeromicrobium erythreum]